MKYGKLNPKISWTHKYKTKINVKKIYAYNKINKKKYSLTKMS